MHVIVPSVYQKHTNNQTIQTGIDRDLEQKRHRGANYSANVTCFHNYVAVTAQCTRPQNSFVVYANDLRQKKSYIDRLPW